MTNESKVKVDFSPYLSFTREEWAHLRASTPLPLTEEELEELRGLNERVSLDEVSEIYLPLSRLLNLYVAATQNLFTVTSTFLDKPAEKVPYIIGIAGSVAVGKSTAARIIQALLARWPNHPKVDLITTDGFLYPNRVLEHKGIMNRKGFPESYDVRKLIQFVADVKSGVPEVKAPIYSHLEYDILQNESLTIRQPDIVIIEGLNVLQSNRPGKARGPQLFLSDFFDFSIYVDADEKDIQNWYLSRFHTLRETAFKNPNSYFHRYISLSDEEADAFARRIWKEINGPNLRENIAPTKRRADLILEKGPTHAMKGVQLRKL